MYEFKVEMRIGQDQRLIKADKRTWDDGWIVFYKKSSQGGIEEYWRVRESDVVSIENRRI